MQNLDLKQAYARLVQAKASSAVQAGAGQFPKLDCSGAAEGFRNHTDSAGTSNSENYGLGFIGGYELDLWGRVRSAAKRF
ncbi:MAG: hypothetical protein GY804_13700 [Alphaproteobacteria bacterium]|nr:hypothetical protein [Alphaproteobacteria bacterium]